MAATNISPAVLVDMFAGVDDETRDLIVRKLKDHLHTAIADVNRAAKVGKILSPQPALIMEAWRLCPISQVRVIILGQDPYIKAGEAMGLSFSVPRGRAVPPSLRTIYRCLENHNYFGDNAAPAHGDLTSWAAQGVLMINAAFTTILGESNAHAAAWAPYTDALVKELGGPEAKPHIFILFGGFAQSKAVLINDSRHSVIEWDHPSPINAANRDPNNPKNFLYCTAFSRANEILESRGEKVIDWGSVCEALPSQSIICMGPEAERDIHPLINGTVLWVFTDGGATANGRAECAAKWAYYMTGSIRQHASGPVAKVEIPGKKYTTSNNRAELAAIIEAMKVVLGGHASEPVVRIITDSKYCINCITCWYAGWLKNDNMAGKENIDLIGQAWTLWHKLQEGAVVEFVHVRGHKTGPVEKDTVAWLRWRGNYIVNALAEFK